MILKQKSLMTTTLLSLKNFHKYLGLLLFVILFAACKNNAESTTTVQDPDSNLIEDENSVIIPEDFPSFYAKFHVDPEFQLNHIQFPLSGEGDEQWTVENWEIHKPFTNTGEFKRDMENIGGIITETIMDNNGMFYIVRRFVKLGDEWKLIFYTQGTNLDGFVPE